MAGHEISLIPFNKIRCADDLGAKAQMRHGHCARLLRVVIEIALSVVLCLFTNDLDRVLVRAHSSIRAEAEEYTTYHAVRFERKCGVHS